MEKSFIIQDLSNGLYFYGYYGSNYADRWTDTPVVAKRFTSKAEAEQYIYTNSDMSQAALPIFTIVKIYAHAKN